MEEELENILHPSRIDSLESKSIRVIVHTGPQKTATHTIRDVYMFQTVYMLKQRIMLEMAEKSWAPEYTFIAVAHDDGMYSPLEFSWEFSQMVRDPYADVGKVESELYHGDAIMPVSPTLYQGLLLKNAQIADDVTVHVWSAGDLAKSVGVMTESIFYGYFKYYFPTLNDSEHLLRVLEAKDDWFTEMLESVETYFSMTAARFEKLNAALPRLPRNPSQLRHLYKLRYQLPKKEIYARGLLEQHFYKMKPSEHTPFMRFFPSVPSLSPLVKIATGTIHKKEEFQSYMADESPLETEDDKTIQYSVILVKSAIIKNSDNVCWTVSIFENGTADLYIGASRSDRPLSLKLIQEAFKILPAFLKNTSWGRDVELTLSELSAEYVIKVTTEGNKPTQSELNKRYDVLVPVFRKETLQGKAFALRYKAVDNFIIDDNPIVEYISFLYLTQSSVSTEAINFPGIHALVIKEFGISAGEAAAYIDVWKSRHNEQIITERDEIIKKYNTGTLLYLQNDHPEYKVHCLDIQSAYDLQLILSLISVFFYNTSEDFGYNKADSAVALESAQEQVQESKLDIQAQQEAQASFFDGLNLEEFLPNAMEMPAADVKAEQPTIARMSEKEFLITKDNSENPFYAQLKARDQELFSKKITIDNKEHSFVKDCQANANRQPNVMDKITYAKARRLYGNDVFWVELPLSDYDVLAVQIASFTVEERFTSKNLQNKMFELDELVSFEKRALQLGFPLDAQTSVLSSKRKHQDAIKSYLGKNPTAHDELAHLITNQQKKPLWTVARAGTVMEQPNYYICAEYWCLREGVPLIPEEFKGTQFREHGVMKEGKPENACPFCFGKLIKKKKDGKFFAYYDDEGGATVLQRESKSDKIEKFVGYLDLYHPDKFAQPCCFKTTSIEKMRPRPGSKPIPQPAVELPEAQRNIIVLEGDAAPIEAKQDINRERPFSQFEHNGRAKNEWYICNQNVLKTRSLEAKETKWQELKRGTIAVPPKEVNDLLGQDPNKFLTKKGINSQLEFPGFAFIRYGLGGSSQPPGATLLTFIAYANYAIEYMITPKDELSIPSNDEIYNKLFIQNEANACNAFIQANYGTLVHEFTLPGQTLAPESESEFQRWKSAKGLNDASQHAFALQVYLAWNNFKNYIQDDQTSKDIRYFETMFTCKGLFSKTGFVLVKIKLTKTGTAVFECPKLGVSLYNQKIKPAILFVVEDEASGYYDPLIFYEGTSDGETEYRRLFGALMPYSPQFAQLQAPIRTILTSFFEQYYSEKGCGRTAPAVHPWVPEMQAHDISIPTLSELVAVLHEKRVLEANVVEKPLQRLTDYTPIRKLLRDRSNRCVGVIVNMKPFKESVDYFIPCVDDGIILMNVPSVFGEEALPLQSMDNVIAFLVGKQSKISENRIAYHFEGLKPLRLLQKDDKYIGIELKCRAIIPFEPITKDHTLPASVRTSLLKVNTHFTEFPWETDIALLGPANPDANSVDFTDEEVLDEAFQHMRVSLAAWFQTAAGARVKKQIELLRQAHKRLPLYELQKRLDLLLHPLVAQSISTEGKASPSILRRDCLQIKKAEDCVGSCTFSQEGRCLIHAKGTPRYVDPVRVITARLTDEFLRTFRQAEEILKGRVSLLRPLPKGAVVQEGDTSLFSAVGRGDSALYTQLGYTDKYISKFTAGLSYPEEVDITTAEDGAYKDKSILFAADVRRDNLARLTVAFSELTGSDDPLPEGFRGTDADWAGFARRHSIDIIKTKLGPGNTPTYDRILSGNYQGAGEHIYGLLDTEGVPVPIIGNKYRAKHSQLSPELQAWLQTQEA
jgi:hypothetical protein